MPAPTLPPAPSAAAVLDLRARLSAWYRANRRDLPWRATRDPYAIWISEAMLQQTRVETVVPYWHRFLARFPDLAALAAAPEADVLAAWSGLGYYRRARALRATAQALVERHGARFPRTRAEMLALPGVGPYTAGAVLSIAFDASEPVVDGNVKRVLCRRFGIDAAPSAALDAALGELAARLVPARGAGEWNQALMELGATVCTARRWRCERCPIATGCAARRADRVGELPRPAPRPAPVDVELSIALVARGGRWLLERRPTGGRMAGLWQLPTREVPGAGGATGLFPAEWTPFAAGGAPVLRETEALGVVRHGITRHRIRAVVRAAELAPRARIAAPYAWWTRAEIAELARTGMTRKVLERGFADAGLFS